VYGFHYVRTLAPEVVQLGTRMLYIRD
jgi:hypothetical protein